jgi:hypothetical protein
MKSTAAFFNRYFIVSYQMKRLKKIVVIPFVLIVSFFAWHLCSFEDAAAEKDTLKDIQNSELLENSNGDSIFFVDSSIYIESEEISPANFTSRSACVIESAAIRNPKLNIFVIILGKFDLADSKQIRVLKSFENIHFLRLDMVPFSKNTPMGKWIESGELFKSKYVQIHVSDAARILLLWK